SIMKQPTFDPAQQNFEINIELFKKDASIINTNIQQLTSGIEHLNKDGADLNHPGTGIYEEQFASDILAGTTTSAPYVAYHEFQVQQPIPKGYNVDTPIKAMVACNRCSDKKRKCDEQRPRCSRCQKDGKKCIYEKNGRMEKARSISQTGQKLKVEIEQLERQSKRQCKVLPAVSIVNSSPCPDNQDEATKRTNNRPESEATFVNHVGSGSNPWIINLDLSKKQIVMKFYNTQQLHEIHAYCEGLLRVPFGLASVTRLIGSQEIKFQELTLNELFAVGQVLPMAIWPLREVSISSFAMNANTEEGLLDFVLSQASECSPEPSSRFNEYFFAHIYTKKQNSSPCMALRYAVAAMSVQHIIMHHDCGPIQRLFANLEQQLGSSPMVGSMVGSILAKKFFKKARELVVHQVFESEPVNWCKNTVSTLFVMIQYLKNNCQNHEATCFLVIALQVAAYLDYDKSLRDKTVVDVEDLEKAIMWSSLAYMNYTNASLTVQPFRTTEEANRLDNFLKVKIRVSVDIPKEKLQLLNASLFMSKLLAIRQDSINTLRDNLGQIQAQDLRQFFKAFDHWADELPTDLRIESLEKLRESRPSFLIAVYFQLQYHAFLSGLYQICVQRCSKSSSHLLHAFAQEAESGYSSSIITVTILFSTYIHAGGCRSSSDM
ncbi:hypothetical protein BC937DRAFT_94417, partial [Endogone sp. FLAS-F59071]